MLHKRTIASRCGVLGGCFLTGNICSMQAIAPPMTGHLLVTRYHAWISHLPMQLFCAGQRRLLIQRINTLSMRL
ncbi:hypothetical protein F4781DRAFT_383928 [Annulohypoxylon bovei var. microspora]|nr:hypothetical protein F4781DRAFT_383928 [Annulohypoxylon bovei var. microspora]